MKKDRNAFFSEYGLNQGGAPNMMMPGGGYQPFPGHMPMGHHQSHETSHHMPMPTDVDSRISKLERAINRLDTRISKLESETSSFPEHDSNFNNSMYMV